MLTSSSGVSPISSRKTYFPNSKPGAVSKPNSERSYDSATFSAAPSGESAFRMNLISRLSQEVRTSTTTGYIHSLQQEVASGTYTPDPMAIAGKMLFWVGG